ncbi:adenosine deaminase [Williamsia limnetica]|jgi:adenosine deaminase|uniref:Adenine deaminase n=1 Tax=Williamsia limnetica TaxID=882452 RepID=A0A318RML1_WILLI|nr:adenosine deaminase [Williamsia limnetica]PYE17383.1 adenosine deaminase [Williamsia limnetica]
MTHLPVAELHLHLEGTLEPETIFELAERNKITLPYSDVDELKALFEFADLQAFLDLYYANMSTLRTAADFAEMTDAYLTRAAIAGVRHAEVFIDPQAHLLRGIALEEVLEGVTSALDASVANHGMSSGLIVSMLRDQSAESAMNVLDGVIALGTPILGIGLDSAEVGHPPSKFVEVYAKARAEGLHLVAHAGEEGPPEYIWEALDLLGVERIDHGIRCMEDERLVERLTAERVPLTVCPLSNVSLKAIGRLSDHPLESMLRRGLNVSVHSDDPSYFGGYIDDNFREVSDALDLDVDDLVTLARNSVTSSFADDVRKAELLAEIAGAAESL